MKKYSLIVVTADGTERKSTYTTARGAMNAYEKACDHYDSFDVKLLWTDTNGALRTLRWRYGSLL